MLGTFRYNRPFVKGYIGVVRPLTHLTKKDVPFNWTPECTEAIRKLKCLVQGDPMLMQPDHDCPSILEVNASQYALGVVLSQWNNAGKLQPVGYFSKTLIPAEQNYDVYNCELLALIRSLEHWRHLLMGTTHPIEVFTDHDGLTKYWQPQKIGRRVACYLSILEEYNMIIKHRARAANKVADALSQPPGTNEGFQENQNVVVLPEHLFVNILESRTLTEWI